MYHSIRSENPSLHFEDALLTTAYALLQSPHRDKAVKVFE